LKNVIVQSFSIVGVLVFVLLVLVSLSWKIEYH